MASRGRQGDRCDLIVVGGGSAAFEVALAARQAGAAAVVMLEKAQESGFGGNARFSHTGFRFCHSGATEMRAFLPHVDDDTWARMEIAPYTEEQFLTDLRRVTRGRIDPVLAEVLVRDSNAALHWMLDAGIEWEPSEHVTVDGRICFEPGLVVNPTGGGLGQLQQWRRLADRSGGIELRFDSAVSGLLGDQRGIEGVEVTAPEGVYCLLAPAVVLCSGGFQANAEMRARYLGPNADLMRVRGSQYDTGEVLRMALDLGARPAGHWQGAHATPIDAGAPRFEASNRANRYGYTYGITVNARGERFFDEGEAEHSYTYAKTGWAVLGQPDGVAYQIFDRSGISLLGRRYEGKEHVEAESVEDLALALGIPPDGLRRTVEAFNAAVDPEVPFDPTRRDGKATRDLTPPKSNWAVPIAEPPFWAFPITGGVTFSFGGLEVTPEARVVSTRGVPIRGLYAVGDIMGLFFHNYPSCSGQTRNVVFARRAAGAAAACGSGG